MPLKFLKTKDNLSIFQAKLLSLKISFVFKLKPHDVELITVCYKRRDFSTRNSKESHSSVLLEFGFALNHTIQNKLFPRMFTIET